MHGPLTNEVHDRLSKAENAHSCNVADASGYSASVEVSGRSSGRRFAGARGISLEGPSWLASAALAGVLTAGMLAWDPHVRDLAAYVLRTELFERSGFSIWNGSWYGGHYLLTHSVLFPPLAALFGARLVAAAAIVWSAYLFDRVVCERWGERARPATLWYAAGAVTMLASGRLSFALGVAFGLASLRALQKHWAWPASFAGLACALASPVAAVFLAGILAAALLVDRERTGLVVPCIVAGVAVLPIVLLNLVFTDAGREPFSLSAWIALPLWCGGALYATRHLKEERALRAVILGYLIAGTVVWLVPNALGGNVTRLGALFGGPVLLAALLSRRVRITTPFLVLLLAGSLWWQCSAAVRDVVSSVGDRSTSSSYYEPLARWLRANGGGRARIEVPFTQSHWETAYLAPEFGLARGWMRQVDRARNQLFYEGHLTHNRYRAWLRRNGVDFVALPDAKNDYSAKKEHALIASAPSYLRLRATLAHWRVYQVTGTSPIVRSRGPGRARLLSLTPQSFVLSVTEPGRFVVRVRSTPFWSISREDGCVSRTGPWTLVRADHAGTVRVSIGFSLGRARQAAASDYKRC